MSKGLFRVRVFLAVVLVATLWGGSAFTEDLFEAAGVVRPKTRVEAPAFTLKSLDGTEKSLSDFRGKVILLNFWATWCVACKSEMPSMERLWREFKDKGLVVVAVAGDRGFWSSSRVKKFVKDFGLTFPVLLDPSGKVRKTYEVRFLPTSYIIGRDGKITGKAVGDRVWDTEAAKRFFEQLLAQ